MVVVASPSFSSYCPCWTSASALGCFGTGWLQLSSVMCFASYFALSRSPSFGSLRLPLALLFCLLLALLFCLCCWLCSCLACRWLCSSACCWLCCFGSFHHSPDLQFLLAFLVPLLHSSFHGLVGCGSVSDSHHWLLGCGLFGWGSVCASSSESLCGSLRLRGSFLASPNTTTQRWATS